MSAVVPPGSDCSLTISGEKKKEVGEYIAKLGPELRKRYGHQKHYSPQQVRQTAGDMGLQFDYLCFAYCLYCSPSDFALVHAAAGEACDYAAMKAEVLADLAGGSFSLFDLDLSWLEWPDIDLSSLFDWFDLSP